MTQLAIGALLAAAVAVAALRAHALSSSGAVAAFVVGAIVFGIGGWPAAAVLFAFFIPSTLLSRVGKARKLALADVGKAGPRDAWQVAANGGVAAACILAAAVWRAPFVAAFAGALAAASADTWATEIGTLAKGRPRSILTLRSVEAGMSGAITLPGTLATIAGGAAVAAVAALLQLAPFWPVAVAGVAGAFADSLLGATVQAVRHCPTCDVDCETDPHRCGTPTVLRRGFSWAENDAVNLGATLCGAAIAGLWVR